MTERKQIKKPTPKKAEQVVEEVQPTKSDEDLKAETDELLDEIDALLEENAQEFVANYIQKGGQ